MTSRMCLVTGATGRQGGATLDALLARHWRVRALTRTPGSPSARRLADRGVEVVAGDLDDTASLERALAGVDAAFLVTNFMGRGASVDSEVRQGKNCIEAASSVGLPHLVFSSVAGAERQSGIPHFESKWRIEEFGRERGIPLTILRPVFFMDNFHMPLLVRSMFVGGLRTVLGQDKRLQMIAAVDIGIIAAGFVNEGPVSAGTALEIAGDALTVSEIKETYRRASGAALYEVPLPRVLLRRMPEEMSRMLFWIGESGFQADLQATRRLHPGVLGFEAWLAREGTRS